MEPRTFNNAWLANRWQGATVCIIAAGPSLTTEDVAHVASSPKYKSIVINESWRLHRDADVMYAADSTYWKLRGPKPEEFRGERWTCNLRWENKFPPGMRVANLRHAESLSLDANLIHSGYNSSFQAFNLAVHWGAKRIVFLGLDLQHTGGRTHWHGDHQGGLTNSGAFGPFIRSFENSAAQIRDMGVDVINATRTTALHCFPRMSITDAIP